MVETGVKMLPKTPIHTQGHLFQSPLPDMLNTQDPLIILADSIDWQKIKEHRIKLRFFRHPKKA